MLSQAIWWSDVLVLLLVARGFLGRLWFRYPVFYAYLLFVLLQSAARLMAYRWWYESWYGRVYWTTEYIAFAMGGLVVFEIYRVALADYPGTAKMARTTLLLLFVLALVKAGSAIWSNPYFLSETSALQVEKALRTVQAISIVALVTVFASYSIPFGKNLRGIFLGYALFVGVRVMTLHFVSETGRDFWFYAYSASYLGALSLWLGHLWSYQPVTAADRVPMQSEYQMIAAATQRRLQEALGYLRKAVH